jgi:hypothetical protein
MGRSNLQNLTQNEPIGDLDDAKCDLLKIGYFLLKPEL